MTNTVITVIVLILGLLTGLTAYTAHTEPDLRERRRLWIVAVGIALAALVISFIPVLPYLVH